MELLLDKIILLFISMLLSFFMPFSIYNIIPLLCIICISGYKFVYPQRKENYIWAFLYVALSFFNVSFIIYLPILLYDWFHPKKGVFIFIILLAATAYHAFDNTTLCFWVFLSLGVSLILNYKTRRNTHLQEAYRIQRDSTKEISLLIEQKNKELIIRQDQDIHIATLNERNRIARDIHDTVGHLLSSSLLQIGAIETLNQQENLTQPILDIKNTLTQGLDSVRRSVHDMHNDAIDLEVELQKVIQAFQCYEIQLIYDVILPLSQANTFHIIAISKEALHNIMKHSNATKVDIIIREQPGFYQFIIRDNGYNIKMNKNGIGLNNMQTRVDSMHGYFNYETKDGFEIFITIPKEEKA